MRHALTTGLLAASAAARTPTFHPPVLIASVPAGHSAGSPSAVFAADASNVFALGPHGTVRSSDGGQTWSSSGGASFPYPLLHTTSSMRSVASAMPLPTDDNGTAAGPRSFAAPSGFTDYSVGSGGQLDAAPQPERMTFGEPRPPLHPTTSTQACCSTAGLPHGAVATCSGKPDGGSCYCGNFGAEYGYKGVPWGRFPGDGLVFCAFAATHSPSPPACLMATSCRQTARRSCPTAAP